VPAAASSTVGKAAASTKRVVAHVSEDDIIAICAYLGYLGSLPRRRDHSVGAK
jgi:hypothetical protein